MLGGSKPWVPRPLSSYGCCPCLFTTKIEHGSTKRCPVYPLSYKHNLTCSYYVAAALSLHDNQGQLSLSHSKSFLFLLVCWNKEPKVGGSDSFKFSEILDVSLMENIPSLGSGTSITTQTKVTGMRSTNS